MKPKTFKDVAPRHRVMLVGGELVPIMIGTNGQRLLSSAPRDRFSGRKPNLTKPSN